MKTTFALALLAAVALQALGAPTHVKGHSPLSDVAKNNDREKKSAGAGGDDAAMSEMSGEHESARSAYGGGYGSGLVVSGGYGSGLGLGGGQVIAPAVRPYSGPAVSVFPHSGLGGCGAIPLLLSCSPSLVQGHLVQSAHAHGGGYAAGGYGYGGGAYGGGVYGGGPVIAPGHQLYRENELAAKAQLGGTAEQAGAAAA